MITARTIEDFFSEHQEDLRRVVELALKIREKIDAIDPFIQQHTSSVCPECRKRCCFGRHAYYECDDIIYLYALGLKPHALARKGGEEPCQFLSPAGCTLDRTVRPSGCNWYFCEPLYDSMGKSPGGEYAKFDTILQDLADLWIEMGAEFRSRFRTIRGYEFEPGRDEEHP